MAAHPKECHNKAWKVVSDYLNSNLQMFAGKSSDADSTVLPALSSWIQESFSDIPECRQFDDHGLVLWCNMTTMGIVGASKFDFMVTAISNLLSLYKRNSIAILIHPNRASQLQSGRSGCNT